MTPPAFKKPDEQKCMLGFDDEVSAVAAFLSAYDDPRFLGGVQAMPLDEFKRKVKAADGEMIKSLADQEIGRLALEAAFRDRPWYFKSTKPLVFVNLAGGIVNRGPRLILKGGKGSGWFGPSHGGSHIKMAPHREEEARSIGAGYDAAMRSPKGDKYDLLTHITPADMEAVAVSCGGWKGIGDITVKGSGFGYVKFIWRHGEKSKKPPHLQISKEDVMAFPGVIRDYEPSRDARPGSPGREWRVVRNHPQHGDRTVVYADDLMDGGRHLVSIYVQEPGRQGEDTPPSKKKAEAPSESPGKLFEARAGDTSTGFLHQPGQSASADSTIPQPIHKSSTVLVLRGESAMDKIDLLKSHIDQYTRKDGTVVQAHEDIRHATTMAFRHSTNAKNQTKYAKDGSGNHEDAKVAHERAAAWAGLAATLHEHGGSPLQVRDLRKMEAQHKAQAEKHGRAIARSYSSPEARAAYEDSHVAPRG